jgi:hypothetical protein
MAAIVAATTLSMITFCWLQSPFVFGEPNFAVFRRSLAEG